MTKLAERVREQLGGTALVALALVALGVGFLHFVLRPMEEQDRALDKMIARIARGSGAAEVARVAAKPTATLAAYYAFFDRTEEPFESLAVLHEVARGTGVELRSAEYRTIGSDDARVERYQVVLPLTGTYAQIRAFLESALEAIPVLSLDQANFRRTRINQSQVEADIVLTLHWLRR